MGALTRSLPLPRSPSLPLSVSPFLPRWLLAWATVILALTSAPYLVWLLWGHSDLERVGSFWFHRDFSQYQAAMVEGARSASWLIHNHFTAEPHQPALIYPLYVAMGKLAAALRLDILAVYYASELVARLALILALYQFVALFLVGGWRLEVGKLASNLQPPTSNPRLLAFLLAAFSLGLAGWLVPIHLALQAVGATEILEQLPSTINVYLEINSFGVFFSATHLMLGLALTLLLPRPYLALVGATGIGSHYRPLAYAGLLIALTVALGVVHPFNLPVVLSLLGLHALLVAWRHGTTLPLWAVLGAGLAAAPLLLYQVALFQFDPFWSQTYGAQNLMPSPSPPSLAIDFGLVLLLAPLGAWALWKSKIEDQSPVPFLLLWCALTLLWMYAPVPFQRRLGFGLQPGLAVLAAVGIVYLQHLLQQQPQLRRWLNHGLLVAAAGTTIVVYLALVVSAARNEPTPVYAWSKAEARAAAWLAERSGPDDVVLAATEVANPIVGLIPGRVVFGHIVATYRAEEKEALMERFFSGAAPPHEMERLLQESRATYVFFGPSERQRGPADLESLASLRPVYDQDGVRLYQVLD